MYMMCLKEAKEEGSKKIENNSFLCDLCVLMENEEFKSFMSKHMNNWIDIKHICIYISKLRKDIMK